MTIFLFFFTCYIDIKFLAISCFLLSRPHVLTCFTVTGAFEEPSPGWIDAAVGKSAILYAVICGLLRIILINPKANVALVPVDYCVNAMIACMWKTAQEKYVIFQIFIFDGTR